MPPEDFGRALKLRGVEEDLWCTQNFETLEKMYRNHLKIAGDLLPALSTFELLDDYCQQHSLPFDIDPVAVIASAGHRELVAALVKVIFGSDPKAKKRCVWVHGERDTGKSTVVEYL
jgi:hypothetical protein